MVSARLKGSTDRVGRAGHARILVLASHASSFVFRLAPTHGWFLATGPNGGVVLLGEQPGAQLKKQADGVEAYDAALLGLTFPAKTTKKGVWRRCISRPTVVGTDWLAPSGPVLTSLPRA